MHDFALWPTHLNLECDYMLLSLWYPVMEQSESVAVQTKTGWPKWQIWEHNTMCIPICTLYHRINVCQSCLPCNMFENNLQIRHKFQWKISRKNSLVSSNLKLLEARFSIFLKI